MEYAYSKGVRCHRDIKPANIMISQDETVKITDFGIAGVLEMVKMVPEIRLSIQQGKIGLSRQTIEGIGFGTPTYMPPEQFINAAECDEKSDIYAFGIVLYQMASGGKLPFLAPLPRDESKGEMIRFWMAMQRLHSESPVPMMNSILFPIIQHCLEKKPGKRYQNFKELRRELEPLLRHDTGEVIKPPELKELKAWEWINKGVSLSSLGRFDESIHCLDKALEIDPLNALAWINKGG
jgi:serine/threonine protein kinase